ncbi:hypothetical protein CCR75_002283 [Bremia lactucae]|uniref:Uncharacterized protein n=1 Tax=Bremia lactucae TaxID=4779 RepID=A0A976IEA4_BRELC|nr:hypothetical protein CCR75_002283 [Bremia lactucae]
MEPLRAGHSAEPRIDEHFDHIRANLIRCEECNENFFFDFLRHPRAYKWKRNAHFRNRYFVTHFKTCHLKSVLYRVNGCSEEENQRVRFGPRRKKDAMTWFSQLKSTEKRMASIFGLFISMQDNKWGEIAERECWSCRLCKYARKGSEVLYAFEPNELGRRQALLHLRQFHETAYTAFLQMLPAVDYAANHSKQSGFPGNLEVQSFPSSKSAVCRITHCSLPSRQSSEAERSRCRRLQATPAAKKAEAERSKRRREQLTPVQRQADVERRARKRQRVDDRTRSRLRRAQATPEAREREMQRSRERRQHATEQQRQREAQRSRIRRLNATEEQRHRERERCRRRYEVQKQQKLVATDSKHALERTTTSTSDQDTVVSRRIVRPAELEQRNQQLLQQQAGLGLQIRALCASLALPSPQPRDILKD